MTGSVSDQERIESRRNSFRGGLRVQSPRTFWALYAPISEPSSGGIYPWVLTPSSRTGLKGKCANPAQPGLLVRAGIKGEREGLWRCI